MLTFTPNGRGSLCVLGVACLLYLFLGLCFIALQCWTPRVDCCSRSFSSFCFSFLDICLPFPFILVFLWLCIIYLKFCKAKVWQAPYYLTLIILIDESSKEKEKETIITFFNFRSQHKNHVSFVSLNYLKNWFCALLHLLLNLGCSFPLLLFSSIAGYQDLSGHRWMTEFSFLLGAWPN